MARDLLAAAALATVVGASAAASCNASVSSSCIGGPCRLGAGGWGGYMVATPDITTSASSASNSSGGQGDAGDGDAGDGDAGDVIEAGPPPNALACPTTPQTGEIPCDVFAVIHSVCNECHVNPPTNGAPFPILTYADTQQPYDGLIGLTCTKDSDCGPSPGSCVAGKCNGLRFQQMFISIGPNGDPQMPFGEGMLPEPQYSTLYDWLGACAPPAPIGTGCGCPGNGCD